MKFKLILLLALAFNYNCFAAQENITIAVKNLPGISDEGFDQRIIEATQGNKY